jgi:hypothetical protein
MTPLLGVLLWSVSAPAPARAQDAATESPAHISVVDGAALLERDGRSESAPASMPLLAGDRVRTQGGRVEILFNDGSTLHLDSNSTVDFQSDEVIRLLGGRVRLNIVSADGANRRVAYRVDAPSAWVQISISGEYRISVLGGGDGRVAEVELAVLRGGADLVNEDGRTTLGAGERAFARAGAGPSPSYVFNSAAWDTFDRWSEARRDSRLGVSAEYLPDTVQAYAATFNQHGFWQVEPTYGRVWFPRVHPGWRPYFHGRWTSLHPWGWTWIGSDPWAWPTHHFGRWGFSAGGWFWIPGRTWGPAWVSWAVAPGFVSWCPLGWNNRAVFGFSFVGGFGSNRWNAWTVVPRHGFGRGFVNVNVINSTRIDVRTRNSFVVREAGPDIQGYAVPRSTAPIRSIGGRAAVSNGESGAYRASRSASGISASPAADAAATFRSRRSSPAASIGTASPAPARESRSLSTLAAPAPSPSQSRTAGVLYPEGRSSSSSPEARSANERRAVPRDVLRSTPGGVVSSTPSDVSPSRSRRAPAYQATPDTYTPGTSSRPDGYLAVPRSDRSGRSTDLYAPAAPYGGALDRTTRSSSQDAPQRTPSATPRSVPEYTAPPAGNGSGAYRAPDSYRSRPGPERSAPAPSGPPPQSAAPSRPSGSSSGSAGGGESRSRGGGSVGGQSSGRAVPRGGRG